MLREVLRDTSKMDLRQSPPEMGQRIHRRIRTLSGKDDPYREIKDWANEIAMKLYPILKARVETSSNPLETAARLAIAGNIIDFGANT
jgi:hypothetical protein